MDIGLQEILLISVIALIVLGPERLPVAVKTIAIWINRFRRSFNEMRSAIEQEINADEIRRQIHNDNIMHELGETRKALTDLEHQLQQDVHSPSAEKAETETALPATPESATPESAAPETTTPETATPEKSQS